MALGSTLRQTETTVVDRIVQINWAVVLLITAIAGFGIAMLYSAANGSFDPWASRQAVRFGIGLVVMLVIAVMGLHFWMRWAYAIYGLGLALLIAVEVMGSIGMGAQRWINLGFFQLQPSEVMKIALVLSLARYFHTRPLEDIGRITVLLPPLAMIAVPTALVLKQPDLGTAVMLVLGSGAIFFAAGVRWWKFALVGAAGAAMVPIAWQFLHDYQRDRVYTFLNPENDPLGTGYHILQSKIALGSGGITGKGFLAGTQSHLSFLPERHTDFIFTMLAEELGLIGCFAVLGLYLLVFAYGFAIALRARSHFGRLTALGLTTTFFLYVFINVAMVTGLIPVVGVPLPLVSYGGTAMMTVMVATGLLLAVYIDRDLKVNRHLDAVPD
jgi:rod shape determining protein RodA